MEYKVGDRVVVQFNNATGEPYDYPISETHNEYETVIANIFPDLEVIIAFEDGWEDTRYKEFGTHFWGIQVSNIIRKVGESKVENKNSGCNCIHCNTHAPMAENNYKQGDKSVFLCFECRSDYMWKWGSLVKI
jgi:hypothetical protein